MRNWESDKALLESDKILHEISIQMFKLVVMLFEELEKKFLECPYQVEYSQIGKKMKRIISSLFLKRETCHW